MFCLPMWNVLCCFDLALKAIILVLAGEKKRPRSLALVAVEFRAVCSFFAGVEPYDIMAISSAYARMSTHVGKDTEISVVIRELNSVGERAEPCGEPVVSG